MVASHIPWGGGLSELRVTRCARSICDSLCGTDILGACDLEERKMKPKADSGFWVYKSGFVSLGSKKPHSSICCFLRY